MQCEWGVTDLAASTLTTASAIGMMLGAVAWGLVADLAGRRTAYVLINLAMCVLGPCS